MAEGIVIELTSSASLDYGRTCSRELIRLRPTTSAIAVRLVTIASLFIVSVSAIAEPASGSDTLVVVLQQPNGMRATHSQPIAADDCNAMLQLLKTLHEHEQSLTLDVGAPAHGSAEVLDIYCIKANGEAVDWQGNSLTAEQVQQRTDELITKRQN